MPRLAGGWGSGPTSGISGLGSFPNETHWFRKGLLANHLCWLPTAPHPEVLFD